MKKTPIQVGLGTLATCVVQVGMAYMSGSKFAGLTCSV